MEANQRPEKRPGDQCEGSPVSPEDDTMYNGAASCYRDTSGQPDMDQYRGWTESSRGHPGPGTWTVTRAAAARPGPRLGTEQASVTLSPVSHKTMAQIPGHRRPGWSLVVTGGH